MCDGGLFLGTHKHASLTRQATTFPRKLTYTRSHSQPCYHRRTKRESERAHSCQGTHRGPGCGRMTLLKQTPSGRSLTRVWLPYSVVHTESMLPCTRSPRACRQTTVAKDHCALTTQQCPPGSTTRHSVDKRKCLILLQTHEAAPIYAHSIHTPVQRQPTSAWPSRMTTLKRFLKSAAVVAKSIRPWTSMAW